MSEAPPAPPGYRAIVPFDRRLHRGRGCDPARAAGFAAALGAIPLASAELFAAGRDYPVVFVPVADRFLPMALTGLEPHRNLWLEADGRWADGRYLPAYVRRFPFCTVAARGSAEEASRPLICVEGQALTEGAEPYLDGDGVATERWRGVEGLIDEMEAARPATEAFCAALVEHRLLERFEMQARPPGGTQLRLTELYRVDERRLNRLSPKKIRALMEAGWLSRIYGHLISLDNFTRLLDRHRLSGGR
ncbi:SapC family protein [Endothiovibrio diazotrophicus]